MTVIDTRQDQMFPVLSASQIETARRFASGEAQRYRANLFSTWASVRRPLGWFSQMGSR